MSFLLSGALGPFSPESTVASCWQTPILMNSLKIAPHKGNQKLKSCAEEFIELVCWSYHTFGSKELSLGGLWHNKYFLNAATKITNWFFSKIELAWYSGAAISHRVLSVLNQFWPFAGNFPNWNWFFIWKCRTCVTRIDMRLVRHNRPHNYTLCRIFSQTKLVSTNGRDCHIRNNDKPTAMDKYKRKQFIIVIKLPKTHHIIGIYCWKLWLLTKILLWIGQIAHALHGNKSQFFRSCTFWLLNPLCNSYWYFGD